MFDTKIAFIVRDDLQTWQRLNVVAFLATGIAAAAPEIIGECYVDAQGRRYGGISGQPMLILPRICRACKRCIAKGWSGN